jgi:hypothetical protein
MGLDTSALRDIERRRLRSLVEADMDTAGAPPARVMRRAGVAGGDPEEALAGRRRRSGS